MAVHHPILIESIPDRGIRRRSPGGGCGDVTHRIRQLVDEPRVLVVNKSTDRGRVQLGDRSEGRPDEPSPAGGRRVRRPRRPAWPRWVAPRKRPRSARGSSPPSSEGGTNASAIQ